MKRSRIENQDLEYNIRVNGRIYAAFLRRHVALDFADELHAEAPDKTIVVDDGSNEILKHNPTIR